MLGAGGGLELEVFTEAQPGWSFVGVASPVDREGLARLYAAIEPALRSVERDASAC